LRGKKKARDRTAFEMGGPTLQDITWRKNGKRGKTLQGGVIAAGHGVEETRKETVRQGRNGQRNHERRGGESKRTPEKKRAIDKNPGKVAVEKIVKRGGGCFSYEEKKRISSGVEKL